MLRWLSNLLGPRSFSLDDPQHRAKLECHLRQDPWLLYVAADVLNGTIGVTMTWDAWWARSTFAAKVITRWQELYPRLPAPTADHVSELLKAIVRGHVGADFVSPVSGRPISTLKET